MSESRTDHSLPACPVEITLSLIENKWAVLILRDLLEGTRRFGELKRSIGHVSQKVLTAQLRAMEQNGLSGSSPKGGIFPDRSGKKPASGSGCHESLRRAVQGFPDQPGTF